ncbi:preprotein translocase subunit YajC [Ruminococcaceae bacterium OttesenSCG-928-I18]|nr:preprotein translocase subunit YajC [Ruminococcaceae bacterium OttesenSCG-928-I18]
MAEMGNYSFLILILVFGAVMYLLIIRPQRKREKKQQELRNSIDIGDEVTTIGGIIGRVVSIKEDTFILETAGDRSRLRFKRWAIQEVAKLSLEGEAEGADKDKKESTTSSGSGDKPSGTIE